MMARPGIGNAARHASIFAQRAMIANQERRNLLAGFAASFILLHEIVVGIAFIGKAAPHLAVTAIQAGFGAVDECGITPLLPSFAP